MRKVKYVMLKKKEKTEVRIAWRIRSLIEKKKKKPSHYWAEHVIKTFIDVEFFGVKIQYAEVMSSGTLDIASYQGSYFTTATSSACSRKSFSTIISSKVQREREREAGSHHSYQ